MVIKEFSVDKYITLEELKKGMQENEIVAFSEAIQILIDNKQNRYLADLEINSINKSTR